MFRSLGTNFKKLKSEIKSLLLSTYSKRDQNLKNKRIYKLDKKRRRKLNKKELSIIS